MSRGLRGSKILGFLTRVKHPWKAAVLFIALVPNMIPAAHAFKANIAFWQNLVAGGPVPPSSIVLQSPSVSPGTVATPTFTVGGVTNGETIRVYSDSTCSTLIATVVSSGTTVNVTLPAVTVGYHNYYVTRQDGTGTSACSSISASYFYESTYSHSPVVGSDSANGDFYGYSVSIASDIVVAGAPFHGGNFKGAAYIYRWSPSTGAWIESKVTAPGFPDDQLFGFSTDVDGLTAVVGGTGSSGLTGKAYVHRWDPSSNTWDQDVLIGSDTTSADAFGYSVGVSGTTVVVGALLDSHSAGTRQGGAYVFRLSTANTWHETKITASDHETDAEFGNSVSVWGNTVVVGAPADDGTGGSGADRGAVYVYRLNSSNAFVETKLTASDAADADRFGKHVSIESEMIAVGAPGANVGGSGRGKVYVYRWNPTGNTWHETILTASDGGDMDEFGNSVSVSGTTVFVGTAWVGKMYVYQWDPSSNTFQEEIIPGSGTDAFGYSVSGSGNFYASGAVVYSANGTDLTGGAYIGELRRFQGNRTLKASDGAINDYLGRPVKISGNTVMAGAYADNHSVVDGGSVYYFHVDPTDLNFLEVKRMASAPVASDWYGFGVDIDGFNSVSGAYQRDDMGSSSGAIYINRLNPSTNTFVETKLLASDGLASDFLGRTVNIFGNSIIAGAYGEDTTPNSANGAVYLYRLNPATYAYDQIKILAGDAAGSDYFGFSTGLWANRMIVGAYGDDDVANSAGSAYVIQFDPATNTWLQAAKLVASDGADSDVFGYSSAISGDIVVVGAYLADPNGPNSGAVYVYKHDPSDNTWHQTKLTPSDGEAYDYFGIDVAIHGTNIIVGSINDDDQGLDAGAAYIFQLDPATNTWRETKLNAATNTPLDYFGRSVDISDSTWAVGAWSNSETAYRAGAVFTGSLRRHGMANFSVRNGASSVSSTTVNVRLDGFGAPTQYCILENNISVASCSWQNVPLPTTFTLSGSQGARTLSAWLKYSDGYISDRRDAPVVYYDTVAPTLTSLSMSLVAPASSPDLDNTPIIRVSGIDVGDTVTLYADPTCAYPMGQEKSLNTYVDIESYALPVGVSTFRVRARDLAGNDSACSTYTMTYEVSDFTLLGTTQPFEGYGGAFLDVVVVGGYYFVAAGDRGVISLAKVGAEYQLRNYYHTTGDVKAIEAFDTNKLIIADDELGIQILQISNNTEMTLLGSYAMTLASDVVVDATNTYAYVGAGVDGVRALNISTPASITSVGTYDTAGTVMGVSLSGTRLYVADNTTGFHILNVTTPASITLLGSFDTVGTAYYVTGTATRAYVADGTSGFTIFNTTTPAAITQIGTYNTTGSGLHLVINGTVAYVADGTFGIQAISFSTEATPTLLGTYDTISTTSKVYDMGSSQILSADLRAIVEVDMTTPATPSLVAQMRTFTGTGQVEFKDNIAYLSDSGIGITAVDLATGKITFNHAITSTMIHVEGNYLYACNSGGLYIYDITTAATPVQVGYNSNACHYGQKMYLRGNYAFTVSYEWGVLGINVADKAAPFLASFVDPGDGTSGMFCENEICYATHWSLGLIIVSIHDPIAPFEIVRVPGTGFYGGTKVGNYLYIGGQAAGVLVYDVSDIYNPTYITTVDTPVSAAYPVHANGKLYVPDSTGGVVVMDISTPSAPVITSTIPTYNSVSWIKVHGNKLILGDGTAGFTIKSIP